MAGRSWWRIRAALVLIAALGISLRVGAAALALTPPTTTVTRDDCNPCVTIVDAPAFDESVTIVDRAAYDEPVTVIDTPASSATRTIVDAPAHTIAHHDLVTAATTVARQVLVTAGHSAVQPALVPGHYERGPDQVVSRGYSQSVWVTSGEVRSVWVPSGYWTSQWQSSGYWGSQWVNDGYYGQVWRPDYYVPWRCWGPDDCDGDYWAPGYSYTGWIDTSHYAAVWIDTSYWTSVYVDTSHSEQQWVDTSHWGQQWVDTSYTTPTQVWVGPTSVTTQTYVPAGYVQAAGCGYSRVDDDDYCWDASWVSTPSWVTPATVWVDPVYTTVYDVIPAVYTDWTEQVAAVTHTETYAIPAVTHQATVHHDALTHLATVHHDAVTHQAQAAALTTQSRQGADPAAATGGATGTAASTPVTIPVVSTITLIDQATRTIQHHDLVTAAETTTRQVLVSPAHDDTVQTWVPETQTRLNTTAGEDQSTFVGTQYGQVWMPQSCYWDVDDNGNRERNCDGGYYYTGVVSPAHYETQFHQGHSVTGAHRVCDDDCTWEYGTYWVEGPFSETVDTSHYVTTTTHTAAVYRTETVTTPAVYRDWDETVPAVTHTETLRYDAIVSNTSPTDASNGSPDDALLGFALMLGLVALGGAGRFVSRSDAFRLTAADWVATGKPLPSEVAGALLSAGDSGTTGQRTNVGGSASIADGGHGPNGNVTLSATVPSDDHTNANDLVGLGGAPVSNGSGPNRDKCPGIVDEINRLSDKMKQRLTENDPATNPDFDPALETGHAKAIRQLTRALVEAYRRFKFNNCGDGSGPGGLSSTALDVWANVDPNGVPRVSAGDPSQTDPNIAIDPGVMSAAPSPTGPTVSTAPDVAPYDPRTDPANYDPINGIYLLDPDPVGTALEFMFGGVVASAVFAVTAPLDLLAAAAALAKAAAPEPAYAPVVMPALLGPHLGPAPQTSAVEDPTSPEYAAAQTNPNLEAQNAGRQGSLGTSAPESAPLESGVPSRPDSQGLVPQDVTPPVAQDSGVGGTSNGGTDLPTRDSGLTSPPSGPDGSAGAEPAGNDNAPSSGGFDWVVPDQIAIAA